MHIACMHVPEVPTRDASPFVTCTPCVPLAPPHERGHRGVGKRRRHLACGDVAPGAIVGAMETAVATRRGKPLVRDYDVVGLIVAALFAASAYTPSLLPRTWFFQGLVAGIAAAMGYGVGSLLRRAVAAVVRRLSRSGRVRDHIADRYARLRWQSRGVGPDTARTWLQVAGLVLLVAVIAASMWASIGWQRNLAARMDMPVPGVWYLALSLPMSVVTWWLIIFAARGLDNWAEAMTQLVGRTGVGETASVAVAWTAVAAVLTLLVGTVLPGIGTTLAEPYFENQNATYRDDLAPPNVPERAAGPGSAIAWEGLGYEGARFIADGLYADELETITGRPATEPIRLYAGVGNGGTMAERAATLVAELNRTRAADREAVMIMPVTGTGWANPVSAQAFELVHDGDTAIVSGQYGVLPSALSLLVDRNIAAEPSRELVSAVARWWSAIPEPDRPKLYLYGESLGTQGVETGLTTLWPSGIMPDGVLMVGPPQGNDIHRWITGSRLPGSPEIRPDGQEMSGVRFAVSGDDAITRARDPRWGSFRMLYLQHDTDPVVWWSPSLIWREPDWLAEPANVARSPYMEWRFFVTFWQVSADLAGASDVPDGYGHDYATEILDAWLSVTHDPRIGDAARAGLGAEMAEAMETQGPEKGHITDLREVDD